MKVHNPKPKLKLFSHEAYLGCSSSCCRMLWLLKAKLYAESSWSGMERGERNRTTSKALIYRDCSGPGVCQPQIVGVWESAGGWIMLLPSLPLSLGICSGHWYGDDAGQEKCLA